MKIPLLRPRLPIVILWASLAILPAKAQSPSDGAQARAYWVKTMLQIAGPVLSAASENQLHAKMPVSESRRGVAHLEAVGRTLAGLAPWLELGPDNTPEGQERARWITMSVKAIANGVNPASPDRLNFSSQGQPLVDAAFLAHALIRAPKQLWGNLSKKDQANLISALKKTRATKPPEMNWLLFSAMVETAIGKFSGNCEMKPIEHAVEKHLEWYKGDGTYGDGPTFHWDYYNSYVIQPMLLDVVQFLAEKKHPLGKNYPQILERARRFAEIQERFISPEGTFPIMGRSSVYRFGAFQTLAQIALLHQLPAKTSPASVRAGMTAVIKRMMDAPGTYDANGWLKVGAVGSQPSLAEGYISTGSLYLCTVGMLELGLPADDPFWTGPDAPWTQKRIWDGMDTPADHALEH